MHTSRSYRLNWEGRLHKNGSGKRKVGLEMGTFQQDDEYLVCTECE